ncbi:MAG TPA: D-hexose-6-phosphate mutarotase [Acidobacteriaceae bacterium]|nr:D-hexose-6-phosphate mutarotase [Acidobacteriaceae bacterium]
MNQSQIDGLNRRFGIPNMVTVVSGNGGLPKIRVTAPWASAEIYLHGAHLTSWKPMNFEEAIFLSAHSNWQDGLAIRGGVPICFPWFRAKADDPSAPVHGVVRTKEWQLESVQIEGESVVVMCSAEDDESTHRWWPHAFRVVHKVSIGKSLRLELNVKNTGQSPFRFEEALHTYFQVGNAAKVRIRGLDQSSYLDNVDGNHRKNQSGDLIFTGRTDNAYIDAYGPVELIDATWRRRLLTEKVNSANTVVWNPGPGWAALPADLGKDEWQQFACVEASNIFDSAISLAPDQEHKLEAIIRVVPEDE